ncbi:MAG: metallophosphoesterase family protein [Candidatus Xenobia bacterium]
MLRAFDGVDAILHGGDVVELSALSPLVAIAPVYVVGGNNDVEEVGARCGYRRALRWRGWRIGLVHGDTGPGRNTPDRAFNAFRQAPPRYEEVTPRSAASPSQPAPKIGTPEGRPVAATLPAPGHGPFDAIVFGHSHVPFCQVREGVLMLNPGSPTERRREPKASFALIDEAEDGLTARMYYL